MPILFFWIIYPFTLYTVHFRFLPVPLEEAHFEIAFTCDRLCRGSVHTVTPLFLELYNTKVEMVHQT